MLLEDIPSRVAQLIANARWDSGDAGRIFREKDVGKIALEGLPDAFNTEEPERIEDPGILVFVSDRAYRQQILCVEQGAIWIMTNRLVLLSQKQNQRSRSQQLPASKDRDPDFADVLGANLNIPGADAVVEFCDSDPFSSHVTKRMA